MPLFFSLAIHNALAEVKENFEPGEHMFAFLEDVYVLSITELVRSTTSWQIQLHAGKKRTWNRAGARPPNMDDVGPDLWNPDGIKILGTPVGHDVCVEEESKLWERIGWVPDVQCAWQISVQCAGPRCHHWLRTVPPRQSAAYAASHDSGMWQAMATVLGRMAGNTVQQEMAHGIATCPTRLGGLLRSATRMAPATFWASWADALLSQRLPALTDQIMQSLDAVQDGGCAGRWVEFGPWGFLRRPEWAQLRAGARPPQC